MTSKLPMCTAKDAERIARTLGFLEDRQTGSHRIFHNPMNRRRVVIPIHNCDLKPGMLREIIKELGITRLEFHSLIFGKSKSHRAA